eukprot:gene3475-biopygen5169
MNLGKSTETQPKSTVTQAQSEIISEAAEQGGGQTAQAAEYPSELQASYSDSPSQELPLQATPVTAWQHNPVFHALSANKTLYTPVHGLATESIGTFLAAEEVVHVPEVTVADTSNSSQSSSPSSAGADKFKTPLAAPSPSAGVTPSGSPDRSVVTSEQGVPSFDAPLKYQSFREKFYNWQQRATTQAPFVPPVSGAGVLQQAVQGFAGLSFVPGATATLPAASSAAAFLASQPAPVASGQSALLQPLVTSSSQAAISRPAFEPVPLQYSAAPVRTSSVLGPSSAFPVQPPTAPLAQFLPATSVLSSSAIPSIIPGLTTSGASAFGFDQVMFGMDSKADDRPKWSGERGVAWLNFQQYWQGKLATVRAQTLGRSVMCSLSLQQEMVLQGMKKDSVGEVDARDVWGCLQQQVYLAELGWFPPVLFPEEAITKVKRRQPAGIPVERILHNALQRCVQPMCQVAAAQSCALTTQVEIDHVLAGNVESPALQAVVLPSGQIRQATGFSRLKYLGRTCSPDQAVMEMFWILMHTMYAVSPQAEKEFYALTQAGSQGTMDIRAFASEVERRYRCVEFVSGVVSEEVTSIIVAGLNSQEGRKYGEQRLEKDRQLSIDQLVEMLEERERTGQVKDLVAAKAARYGYVTGSSSSKSGKHLKADTDTGAQTSSTEMSKLVAKIRKQRGGYLRQLAKDNLPDAESIEKAIDYLITHPSHPKSLCISHWEKGNLHTKAECKSPDGTALAGMGVGGQQSGGQSGEGATGDRLFRAPPKPPAAPKGKKDYGVQPPAGTAAQPNTTCPVCQFPSGHPRGICFFAQPNMAADWWGGPNRRADPQVVVRYIEACAQQRVVPRLSRCGQTVDALLGSDSLSPQARAMLQQQFGQLGPPPSPNTTYMPQAQNRYAPRPMPTAYVPQHMATLQQTPMPMTGNYQAFACQMPQDMSAAWQMQPLQHALPPLPQTPGPPMASAANAYVLPATPMFHASSGQQQMPMTPASGQGQPQLMSVPAQPQLLTASSSGYVQQPQAFMAASTQPDPNQASSSSSGYTGPRGYGWCQTVISETESVGLGAFAATRASTSRTSADTRRQPVPKSFVASDPVLPRDPNGSRTTEQQIDTLQEETGVSTEQAWTAVQAAMTKHELSLQQLTEQLAILNSLLPTTQTAATVAADDPIALMASVLEGISSGGFAQAFDVPVSSAAAADSSCQAMMSETPIKPARSVAYSGKNHYGDVAANFPQELLFQPPNMSYALQQQQRQGLDRFCSTSKRTGLTLVLSDDREILLDGAFHDSGANLLLLTQALCKEIGLTYRQGSGVPGVRGWKGFKEKVLLGYTDPFKLVFAKGTSYETTLHVPTGYVVPGDAQGMYTLCLDKQTVFAVFGHVNPLLQHFCWYPWIAQGDRRHLAGIPIRSFVSASSGESVQTAFAFSAAREQLQRIHSLTGLEPAVPDLMDMQLERVAEATLETIIRMEREQRETALRWLALAIDGPELVLPQRAVITHELTFLGHTFRPHLPNLPPLLLPAPPAPQSTTSSASEDSDDGEQSAEDLSASGILPLVHETGPQPLVPGLSAMQVAGDPSAQWFRPGPEILQHLEPQGPSDVPHDAAWSIHPEGKWVLGNHPEASAADMQAMVDMLFSNKAAFAYDLDEVPGYQGPPIDFPLIDQQKNMFAKQRQYTTEEFEFGDDKLKEMLQPGIVVEIPTTNPYVSCITLPLKRAPDGSWTDKRFCIDLRDVNANITVDHFGMPLPEEIFRRIAGAKFLAKIDMRAGFWQIRLPSEQAQQLTAFWWRGRMYAYTRLPFGYVNATAVFQRVMDTELAAAGIDNATVFVDDVLLWADTFEAHLQQLDLLFKHFVKVGLRAHPAKTVVAAQTIGYLGHLISATECQPEEAKVAAIKALEPPTTVKRLQAHLGLFNYYRAFVPGFSRIAQPLYKLTAKDVVWEWTDACQQAFDELKDALCTPGLALRQPDSSRPFHLFTDWSQTGLAAVLQQKTDDDTQYLVACASRSLNAAERNYPAWKGEMLAVVWGVREPLLCAADSTGARLDEHTVLGPLPTVLHSDMTPDETPYTHEGLTQDLGITAWSPSQLQAAAAAWALLGGLQLGPSFQPAPSLPGLEMVLRNGFTVSRYLYSDTDLTAQTIALHRIMQLQEQYPLQLQQQALEGCFSAMPEDITDITMQHVHAAVLSQPSAQWLVVAGWPCQDFSLAGPSRGMAAARSRLLTDLVRLIGILQQLLPEQPPGYLLENVPMQYHRNSMIAQQDFDQVTRAIGQPVVLDAAQ